jgi:pyruvate dehydrogenase E1 component beta subunit
MREITYQEALNEAMIQEMQRDENIFVYGLDVSDHKRIFGSTVGLCEKFGRKRCFITPLSEDAMTGMGLGAALCGLRPIHVHQRVDFLVLAMNQLSNMVSIYRYMSGGKVKIPLVIRAVVGRGWGQSAQHSKSMHSIFAHIPGLKVVLPTTPEDAKGLLISAIRDDNPVIFLEHRWLYFTKGEVPEKPEPIALETSNILREGKDITIIATSWMNVEAIKAAEVLEKVGVSVEVVDPRTIAPLNDDLLIKSVKKTGHCIVADNDWIHCGASGEIASRISEKCFNNLKSPVNRVGFAHSPCPTTRPLENVFYPNAINLIRLIEEKLELEETDLSVEEFYSWENRFKGPF